MEFIHRGKIRVFININESSYTCKGANRSIDITNDSKYLFTGSLDGNQM